jgi:hypothetical protein
MTPVEEAMLRELKGTGRLDAASLPQFNAVFYEAPGNAPSRLELVRFARRFQSANSRWQMHLAQKMLARDGGIE